MRYLYMEQIIKFFGQYRAASHASATAMWLIACNCWSVAGQRCWWETCQAAKRQLSYVPECVSMRHTCASLLVSVQVLAELQEAQWQFACCLWSRLRELLAHTVGSHLLKGSSHHARHRHRHRDNQSVLCCSPVAVISCFQMLAWRSQMSFEQ